MNIDPNAPALPTNSGIGGLTVRAHIATQLMNGYMSQPESRTFRQQGHGETRAAYSEEVHKWQAVVRSGDVKFVLQMTDELIKQLNEPAS